MEKSSKLVNPCLLLYCMTNILRILKCECHLSLTKCCFIDIVLDDTLVNVDCNAECTILGVIGILSIGD